MKLISVSNLFEILSSNPCSVLLIDCRPVDDFRESSIWTSINVSLSEVSEMRKLEDSLPYSDKLFLKQREFTDVILYTSSSGNGKNDSEVDLLLGNLFTSLKFEGRTKQVLVLEDGFSYFYLKFPNYCLRKGFHFEEPLGLKERMTVVHRRILRHLSRRALEDTNGPMQSVLMDGTIRQDSSLSGISHPSMILPYLLLGDAKNAYSRQLLKSLNVKFILNVAKECKNHFQSDFVYKKYPFVDDDGENLLDYLDDCCQFIEKGREHNSITFVHCFVGMSRSAAVVVGYLMKFKGLSLEKALTFVKRKRPCVDINVGFISQLKQYEKKLMIQRNLQELEVPPTLDDEFNEFLTSDQDQNLHKQELQSRNSHDNIIIKQQQQQQISVEDAGKEISDEKSTPKTVCILSKGCDPIRK